MTSIKQKSKEAKGLVINTLVVRKLNRNVLDVGQWRQALRAADNDRRQKLYELYEDILLDPVLSSAITKRINAITNAELVFMRDGNIIEEMDDFIDSPVFEELLTEIMNSKMWGKTVMELDFMDGFKAYNIPRAHIRPDKGLITINPGDDQGYPYRGDDFFLEAGSDKDFGLLLKAAPYAIFKRGGLSDWAQFCELFGIPMKVGKYSAQDEESRKALTEALEDSGSASWLVTPKETDIEVKESSSRGDGNLFNNFRKACNEEMLITILGQTMTTVDGSSRAQSQTHKEVEEDINKSDRRFVQRILNTELLPRLEKRGFPVKGGWFSFPEAAETISKIDLITIHDKFQNNLGLIIDDDFLYDTYGVPKPKDGITRKETRKDVDEPVKKKKEEKKQEKEKESLSDEKSFWRTLREGFLSFFVKAPGLSGAAGPVGDLLTNIDLSDIPSFDIEGLARRVSEGTNYFDPDLFYFTSRALIDGIHRGFLQENFADIGIEYGYTPDAFKTAMEINLFHFSAAKDLAEIQTLNEAFRDSTGWYDFLKRARNISGKFNEAWLRTEYNTAYLTAESSATYQRLIKQSEIFPLWQYVTINDNKVREEHRKLHLIILPFSDPYWKKIWPPNGWNCRCRVTPKMKHEATKEYIKESREKVEEYLNSKEWRSLEAQGWGVNRALSAEVFTANQMYIRKFPTMAASYLNKLTFEKWGLDPVLKLMKAAENKTPVFSGTADDIWNTESNNGLLQLSIYDNRSIVMDKASFYLHATNRKEQRIKLWSALKESLQNPDEVWLNNYSSDAFDNINIIKYYKDRVITASYKIESGELVLKTWHDMYPKKIIWRKKRRGLLITKQDSH